MNALTTELLARIEMLEDDVRDLQRQLDEGGVVFYADMNLVSDEQLLDLWDIEGEPEQ
jgi:hypothetical protein